MLGEWDNEERAYVIGLGAGARGQPAGLRFACLDLAIKALSAHIVRALPGDPVALAGRFHEFCAGEVASRPAEEPELPLEGLLGDGGP